MIEGNDKFHLEFNKNKDVTFLLKKTKEFHVNLLEFETCENIVNYLGMRTITIISQIREFKFSLFFKKN